jgi:hypothetical protein
LRALFTVLNFSPKETVLIQGRSEAELKLQVVFEDKTAKQKVTESPTSSLLF